MRVVATKAGNSATIHDTLHEVVALHPILVRCALGEMRKTSYAQRMIL
jgi:hypothetical protein